MHLLCQANALRIPLADKSVHMCVCSPPYWGLRDYGTARWEGGDPECDHLPPIEQKLKSMASSSLNLAKDHSRAQSNVGHQHGAAYRKACRKCGARRIDNQLGLEPTPDEFIRTMVEVFREIWRTLRDDGTCWINIGDSYSTGSSGDRRLGDPNSPKAGFNGKLPVDTAKAKARLPVAGMKPKDLVGIPWRLAFALQADGWYLRSDIIWAKPNPMPESVTDRPTKSHEYMFLLSKQERYYFDADAVREDNPRSSEVWPSGGAVKSISGNPSDRNDWGRMITQNPAGRNIRTVWSIPIEPFCDVYVGGTSRITSPDCPVHGCQAGPAIAQGYGGQSIALPSDHSQHTDGYPVQEPASVDATTPEHPSAFPADEFSAKRRNKRSRKKEVESKQGEISDDKPADHIEYTEPEIHCNATSDRMHESNTSDHAQDVEPSEALPQNPCDNGDNSACAVLSLKCTCNYIDARPKGKTSSRIILDVWSIPTEAYAGRILRHSPAS